jgi:Transcriptional regulators
MKKLGQPNNLTDQALNLIRQSIMSGELEAGRQYSAAQLAERLGVSRTPVREALLQLSSAGMVAMMKNRGVQVLSTSIDDLLDGFQVRLMLEVPAAAHAATIRGDAEIERVSTAFTALHKAAARNSTEDTLRADRDFHLELVRVTGNSRIVSILKDLRNVVLLRGVGTVPLSRTCQETADDHNDIFESFLHQDGPGAAKAMRRHILNTARLLIRQEAQSRQEFAIDNLGERLSWPNDVLMK